MSVPERTIFAVVYAIHTGSLEPGGRPVLRGRDGMRDRAIFEQNPDLEHLLRTEFSALIVGYQEGSALRTYLPPSPPPLHWTVMECEPAEIAKLTRRLDYFRTILAASDAPVPHPRSSTTAGSTRIGARFASRRSPTSRCSTAWAS